MIISIELRPLFRWRAASGKRGAADASPARRAVSVSRWRGLVGRSVVGSVMFWRWGRVIVWRICSAGVAVSEIVSGLSYHAHARARAASRRPCDNVYIIARYSPAPGVVFKSFRAFQSPGSVHQLPSRPISLPFLFPTQNQLSLSQTHYNAPLA